MRIPSSPQISPQIWLATLALLDLLVPSGAAALTIADVLPLYLEGTAGQGFALDAVAGLERDFSATADDDWIAAGAESGLPVLIEEQTLTTVHQLPSDPSLADPVIADSTWRIRNVSAGDLIAPLLVFTTVDPLGVYPIDAPLTGLDGNGLDLLSYSFGGADFVYGVIPLPDLMNGQAIDITVRYLVAGDLAPGSPAALPPLGVSVLGSYQVIPEPSTAILLGFGLLLCAGAVRRRVA